MKERIEKYFNNELNDGERLAFEQALLDQPRLADETAFYIQSRRAAEKAAKERLLKDRHQRWQSLPKPVYYNRQMWIGIAAAIILIFGAVLFFAKSFRQSPSERSITYFADYLHELPVHLGGDEESLQNAIKAYNEGRYQAAVGYSETFLQGQPNNSEALKVLGLSYLQLQLYQEALSVFHRLSTETALYSNPGKFYEALSYLLRNKEGDALKGQKLLQEVIDKNLEGKQAALTIMNKTSK